MGRNITIICFKGPLFKCNLNVCSFDHEMLFTRKVADETRPVCCTTQLELKEAFRLSELSKDAELNSCVILCTRTF